MLFKAYMPHTPVRKIHHVLKISQKESHCILPLTASFNIASEQTDVETINSRKEQTESEFKDLTQQVRTDLWFTKPRPRVWNSR